MDIETEVLREHSKAQALKIAKWVGNDKKRFGQLMKLFLKGDYRTTQRAVWSISHCADCHPELVYPWFKQMIKKMQESNVHNAVSRNVLHILQFVDIPTSLQGEVAAICFDFLYSPVASIAVKVFSMSVLERIAKNEPDLKRELKLVIQQMLPYGGPAIRSRGKKILKLIEEI